MRQSRYRTRHSNSDSNDTKEAAVLRGEDMSVREDTTGEIEED